MNVELYSFRTKGTNNRIWSNYSTEGIARNVASLHDGGANYKKREEFRNPGNTERRKYEIVKLVPVMRQHPGGAFVLDLEWVSV